MDHKVIREELLNTIRSTTGLFSHQIVHSTVNTLMNSSLEYSNEHIDNISSACYTIFNSMYDDGIVKYERSQWFVCDESIEFPTLRGGYGS